jgi:SNF2 family DNA or RNA helicase
MGSVLTRNRWNPAVEEQAVDRVHRIGQRKPVYVTKMTIVDTVEDKMLQLQESKVIRGK